MLTINFPFFHAAHTIHESLRGEEVALRLRGPFLERRLENATNFLYLHFELLNGHDESGSSEVITAVSQVALVHVEEIGRIEEHDIEVRFHLGDEALNKIKNGNGVLRLHMSTNIEIGLGLTLAFDPSPIDETLGVVAAAIVLLSLYVLIIWEIVHRTFAAMVASTLALAVLAIMHHKPSMEEIVAWIDYETLLLLFGMMVLVAILSETGVFDFLAVFAYKV